MSTKTLERLINVLPQTSWSFGVAVDILQQSKHLITGCIQSLFELWRSSGPKFLGLHVLATRLKEGGVHVQGFQLPTSLSDSAKTQVARQVRLHWRRC